MLWRVDHRPHDLQGLFAALFTGAGSASVVVGRKWAHFTRTGRFSGHVVIEDAAKVLARKDVRLTCVRQATDEDERFIRAREGMPWRPWHNCFSAWRPLWAKIGRS